MPTILVAFGIRLFFYSEEGNEPVHVHVEVGGAEAKFWITKNGGVQLARKSKGMKASDLSRSKKLIRDNISLVMEKWYEHFGR